jgi:hypothetical protein
MKKSMLCRLARREKSIFEAVCCGRCGCGKLFLVTSLTKSLSYPHNPPPLTKREEKNHFFVSRGSVYLQHICLFILFSIRFSVFFIYFPLVSDF